MAVFEDGSIGLQAVDAYILFNLTLGLKLGAIIGPKLGQELILLNPPLLVHDRVEDAVDADYVLVAKAPGVSGQQCSVSVWLTQVSVLVVRIFPVLVF